MSNPSSVINGGESSAATAGAGGTAQPNQPPQAQATSGNNNNASHQQQHHPTAPRGAFSSPFSSAGRFPFDDSDDDMFGDLDMRARMNRMGAFDWNAHKRAGGGVGSSAFPDADAFFNNDFGFPSAFGSAAPQFDSFANRARNAAAAGRKPPTAHAPTATSTAATGHQQQQQPQQPTPSSPNVVPPHHDRSHFYDHLPEEFRQYFPESFGHSFPRMRHHSGGGGMAAQSPPTTGFVRQQQPQYQPQPEQHFVQQPAQPQQQQHPVPAAPAPAAAARPKLCDAAIQTDTLPSSGNDLHQPAGLRNTVDMGQKCQQESVGGPERAHSAPPAEQLAAVGGSPAPSSNSGPYETAAGAFANTGTSMTPQQPQLNNNSQQFVYPKVQQQQQQSTPTTPLSGGERQVPIFVEGRSAGAPVPPQRTSVPPPARPTPFVPCNDQVDNSSSPPAAGGADVPQTPHTADCISKIQTIQSNVLDLMGAVDRFAGCRGDKEYMYIDEMLTRNLLKLDTIDTQGRESIRLARKEAIRCIQASITVLEAKAEQNTNLKKAEAAAAAAAASTTTAIAATTTTATADVAAVAAKPAAENIEQSLEDKLADFQRNSEEREVESFAEPETHVSALQVNLKPAGKTN